MEKHLVVRGKMPTKMNDDDEIAKNEGVPWVPIQWQFVLKKEPCDKIMDIRWESRSISSGTIIDL